MNNVYYPEDGQQLVWVKWHTPSTEQHITISVSVSGGGNPNRGTITANIVDLDKNPPPNPVADDRNDSYNAGNAIVPANPQKTNASWSGGKNTGYGIVTGNGIPAHILRPVLRDVPVATDIGKMRENMWMKAGGNLI